MDQRETPDTDRTLQAKAECDQSTEDSRDTLLTDLLCHTYRTLASQNG